MKKYIGLIAILFLIPSLGIAGDEIINGVLQEAGGSSEWTLSGTGITPKTADAVSNPGSYTSTASTGVFQFGTQAAIGATYSPVTGGGRIGIGTTAPSAAIDISLTGGTSVYGIELNQSVDAKGIIIYGWDDKNDKYLSVSHNSDGAPVFNTNTNMQFAVNSGQILNIQNGGLYMQNDKNIYFGFASNFKFGYDNAGDSRFEMKEAAGPDIMAVTAGTGFAFYTPVTIAADGTTVTFSSTSTAMLLTPVFATDLNGTGTLRPVVINQTAQIGYDSSTELGKMNWEEIDTSILDLLNPGSYEPKKPKFKDVTTDRIVTDKTADGADVERIVTNTVKVRDGWLEESAGYKRYGLKAEEVAAADKRLVFYGARADGSSGPAGVNYLELVPVLLKKIQEQDAVIANILKRLEALEAK